MSKEALKNDVADFIRQHALLEDMRQHGTIKIHKVVTLILDVLGVSEPTGPLSRMGHGERSAPLPRLRDEHQE